MSESESAAAEVWSRPLIDPADTPAKRALNLAEIEENAYRDAYDKGYAAGLTAGETAIAEQSARFSTLAQCLSKPLAAVDEEVETALRDLSFRIARHVVRRELQIDKSQVVGVIREALQALPLNARNVRVFLHPADVELVENTLSEPKSSRTWSTVEDPLLTRGGCRVESDASRIDGEVDERLARILDHLVENERSSERGRPDNDG